MDDMVTSYSDATGDRCDCCGVCPTSTTATLALSGIIVCPCVLWVGGVYVKLDLSSLINTFGLIGGPPSWTIPTAITIPIKIYLDSDCTVFSNDSTADVLITVGCDSGTFTVKVFPVVGGTIFSAVSTAYVLSNEINCGDGAPWNPVAHGGIATLSFP